MIDDTDIMSTEEALNASKQTSEMLAEMTKNFLVIEEALGGELPDDLNLLFINLNKISSSNVVILLGIMQTILVNQEKILQDLAMMKKNGKNK